MKYVKLFEQFKPTIKDYIKMNNIKCDGIYPSFIYHATNKNIKDFVLDHDMYWEDVDGNGIWDFNMPSGVLFLTNDINEALRYGRYIIPFELNTKDILIKKIYSDNPSQIFDEDYNYGTKFNLWQDFENSSKDCLEVKGLHKSTFISYFNVLNPRLDIAEQFYLNSI